MITPAEGKMVYFVEDTPTNRRSFNDYLQRLRRYGELDDTTKQWLFDGEEVKASSFDDMVMSSKKQRLSKVSQAKRELAKGILRVFQSKQGQAILSTAFQRLTALDPMLEELKGAKDELEDAIEKYIADQEPAFQ